MLDKDYIIKEVLKSQGSAFDMLPAIIKQYGKFNHNKYSIWLDNNSIVDGYSNRIDYHIVGFTYKDNKTYIQIFWQLDNADGEEVVEMPKPYDSVKVEINANLYFYVDSDDIYQAIKNLKF